METTRTNEPLPASETCEICCRCFTVTFRKKTTCFNCQRNACLACVRKYIMSSFRDEHCMFCQHDWSRAFVDDLFPESFRTGDLRRHRENLLCEREKAKLPETQALFEAVQKRLLSLNQEHKLLMKEYDQLHDEFEQTRNEYEQKKIEFRDRRRNFYDIFEQRKEQERNLHRALYGFTDVLPNDRSFSEDVKKKVAHFFLACPNQHCQGYLDNGCVCRLCKTRVCPSCFVVLDENVQHTCDPDYVKTVVHLNKETKLCPGCGARIAKAVGCDQMWCTLCHTAFDWNTGERITRGQFHNPHFYEWRRGHGGLAEGAVDRQGCPLDPPSFLQIKTNILELVGAGHRIGEPLQSLHNEIDLLNKEEILVANPPQTDPHRELRIDFLTGRISEKEWKRELHRREREKSKSAELLQVSETYVDAMKDLFRAIATAATLKELGEIYATTIAFVDYVQDAFQAVHRRYGKGVNYLARFGNNLRRYPNFVVKINTKYPIARVTAFNS